MKPLFLIFALLGIPTAEAGRPTVTDPDLEPPKSSNIPASATTPTVTTPRIVADDIPAEVVGAGESCPEQPISGIDYNRLVAGFPGGEITENPRSFTVCLSPSGLAGLICNPLLDKDTEFSIPNSFAQQFGLGRELDVHVQSRPGTELPADIRQMLDATIQGHADRLVTVTPNQLMAGLGIVACGR